MASSLLIVESPTKANTIKKYLGKNFEVLSSVGHIIDLPTNKLGIDLKNSFKPDYVTIKGKDRIIKDLKEAGKKAQTIYLGADPDREGEAICWHISNLFGGSSTGESSQKVVIHRVLFHEITEKSVLESIKNPQSIDMQKVNAQQARRVLDRLVGYQISPLLWKKVQKGLSAGRVQSVAVRVICEREREIKNFIPEEYWSITAHLKNTAGALFTSKLEKIKGKKEKIKNIQEAQDLVKILSDLAYQVDKISITNKKQTPEPPFTTSRLQQEASRKLKLSPRRCMSIAQKLYEGVTLRDGSSVGLITYMRTDSTRLSPDSQEQARTFIKEKFGSEFLPSQIPIYKNRKGVQDAHEAIRPTLIWQTPAELKGFLSKEESALYKLIWDRFTASQMKPALIEQTDVFIKAGIDYLFKSVGRKILFKGFLVLYQESEDKKDPEDEAVILPVLQTGELLNLQKLEPKQNFTQPPAPFSEASLVRELEVKGIGRPSTYAAILATIIARKYVILQKRIFCPTELGFLVNDLLVENFPNILNVKFTAYMEDELDKIEEGQRDWIEATRDFYDSFSKDLLEAEKKMPYVKAVKTDISCSKCGKEMVIRRGKNGRFLACSGYPQCKNAKDFEEDEHGKIRIKEPQTNSDDKKEPVKTGIFCSKCEKEMVIRWGKNGRFLACSGYPKCKNAKEFEEDEHGNIKIKEPQISSEKCPKCGKSMLVRNGRYGQFLSCEDYPKCKGIKPLPSGIKCPEDGCTGELVQKRSKKGRFFYSCSNYPKCEYSVWDKPVNQSCPECQAAFILEKYTSNGKKVHYCSNKDCKWQQEISKEE